MNNVIQKIVMRGLFTILEYFMLMIVYTFIGMAVFAFPALTFPETILLYASIKMVTFFFDDGRKFALLQHKSNGM
jgi:hypothetical protein